MIENKMCDNCDHLYVCNKLKTIGKFDNEIKGFIGVDIKMLSCDNYQTDLEEGEITE